MPSEVTPYPSRSGNDNAVREDDLQAYVDGQLDARRRATIEAHLAAHPGEAARLAAYRNQNIGLHALFDPPGGPDDAAGIADLPPALTALARKLDTELCAGRSAVAEVSGAGPAPASAARRAALPRRLAASVALLLAAGVAGWIALQQAVPSDTPRVALSHGNQAAPQAAIQVQPAAVPIDPAAAAPLAETLPAGSTEAATPATSQPALEKTADPAQNPANIDPAIERTPLIPVPQPVVDTASKDT